MSRRRLRIASHIHSSWSDDSDWSLVRLAAILRRAGFDGALVCDHDRTLTEERRQAQVDQCREITAGGFVMVPGVEYQDPQHQVHLPTFGDVPFFGRSPDIGEVLAQTRAAGGLSVFAHPARRSAHEAFDPAWAPLLGGVEVWNRKYDGVRPNAWAVSAASTYDLQPFVGLDFHGPRQIFPLAMVLDAGVEPSWEGVLAALHARRCRAEAFRIPVLQFANGPIDATLRHAESARKFIAPRVRRIEQLLLPPGGGRRP